MNGQNIARTMPVGIVTDPIERLSSLFDDHYDRLYRMARRLTGSADDASDLVQETFLRAARSPKSIPADHANEEAWLVRVLINLRRDQWRKEAIRKRHDRAYQLNSLEPTRGQNPENRAIAKATVWRALDALPPRRRAIVVMHELEGLSIPAIASLLGISAITVRWHLSIGRRDLSRALGTHLGGKK
jgi:RNA polymerase sigma factor (sigma-70 family)